MDLGTLLWSPIQPPPAARSFVDPPLSPQTSLAQVCDQIFFSGYKFLSSSTVDASQSTAKLMYHSLIPQAGAKVQVEAPGVGLADVRIVINGRPPRVVLTSIQHASAFPTARCLRVAAVNLWSPFSLSSNTMGSPDGDKLGLTRSETCWGSPGASLVSSSASDPPFPESPPSHDFLLRIHAGTVLVVPPEGDRSIFPCRFPCERVLSVSRKREARRCFSPRDSRFFSAAFRISSPTLK